MKTRNKAILALYNTVQFLTMPIVLPAAAAVCLSSKKYRHQFPARMGFINPPGLLKTTDNLIWIHAMSLGEFNAARPLILGIKDRFPEARLLLSASTATGLAAVARSGLADKGLTTCLPFDFLPIVARTVKLFKPSCFLLIETDIWPNFLWHLKRCAIPAFLINGSISGSSAKRLAKIPGMTDFIYSAFTFMGMQSDDDAGRLLSLGVDPSRILNCGNLKFDYAPRKITEEERKELFQASGFEPNAPVITAGSTHPGEEEIIAAAFSELRRSIPQARLIIAPRDIERSLEVQAVMEARGMKCKFRSEERFSKGRKGLHQVFILDTLGELERFYSLSRIAFVGGSLVPVGGHNILEPASFGIPVLFGPYMESFRQTAEQFLKAGGGFQVKNSRELYQTMKTLLADENMRTKAGDAAKGLLETNRGAVEKYLDIISPCIRSSS